jgi:hypothetical protein
MGKKEEITNNTPQSCVVELLAILGVARFIYN